MDPKDVKCAVVVGGGIMGHSITQVFAQAGIETGLVDVNEDILARAKRLIASNLETLAEFGRADRSQIPSIMARIKFTTDLEAACQGADFALEAVSETPEIKKKVFDSLDKFCPPDAVIASNTSSLDVFSIADIGRTETFVVAHWFAPPHIVPLVEVCPGPKTSYATVEFTAKLMERLGKRVVVLKQFAPSFIVNRIQAAIFFTALQILGSGFASMEDIDYAVKTSLGIRLPVVGVLQTYDFTGLNLVVDTMKSSGIQPPPVVADRVAQGHLGASTSKGFYDYGGRSEEEILKKRDERYLKVLDTLEKTKAFEPV